jgi:metal-responsive CopG/Arc/MetJ family transcriptional regulator
MKKTYTLGHLRGETGRKKLKKVDRLVKREGYASRVALIEELLDNWVDQMENHYEQ